MKKDPAYRRTLTAANFPLAPNRLGPFAPDDLRERFTRPLPGAQLIIRERRYAVVTVMSFLTDHREIHLEVLGRRVLEVHPASVDPLVVELDRLQRERGRLRHGDEVGPRPHGGAVRPVQGLVESPSPHVETARISHRPL